MTNQINYRGCGIMESKSNTGSVFYIYRFYGEPTPNNHATTLEDAKTYVDTMKSHKWVEDHKVITFTFEEAKQHALTNKVNMTSTKNRHEIIYSNGSLKARTQFESEFKQALFIEA